MQVKKCSDDRMSKVCNGYEHYLRETELYHVQGKISGNTEIILKKSPGSESVGYGLKIASNPCRMNIANSGSCLQRFISWSDSYRFLRSYLNFTQTGAAYITRCT